MKKVDRQQIINLRLQNRYGPKKISDELGISRARVYFVLNEENITPNPDFPELLDPETFTKSDEIIAQELNLSVNKVAQARKSLNIKSPPKVSLGRRRRSLVRSLFGKEYLPGPNFITFIQEQIEKLSSEHRKVLIQDFYINGKTHSLADNVNSDSDRVYRVVIKDELKGIVGDFEIEDLISQNIIQERNP